MNRPPPPYYTVLGLLPSAEQEVVDAAYRALIKKHHPDKVAEPDATRAQSINEAYETLGNPRKRSAYDAAHGWFQASTGGDSPDPPSVFYPQEAASRAGSTASIGDGQQDGAMVFVRRSLVILSLLLTAIFFVCLFNFASGAWKSVPDIPYVGRHGEPGAA